MTKRALASFACTAFILTSLFAQPADMPSGIPQAGEINSHDLEILKQQQLEKQMQEDFQNYERQKEEQQEEITPDIEKKIRDESEKARLEEFDTAGVYIEKILVSPSAILTEKEINEIVEPYNQTNLTFEELQELLDKINKLYLEKGYVTARAYLPEQTIEDETLRIELLEGKIGDTSYEGNKWTRKKYIEDRLNLKKGSVFNLRQLEQNMTLFNRYNEGVSLNSVLAPGKSQMGTTDVDVKVNEKLPFHVSLLYDNAGRSTIGKNRFGLTLQDDSLFGMRDKLTIGAYFNSCLITPFADYNIPITKMDDRIGFSFSSSNTKIGHGDYKIFNIKSRSQNYSLYYTRPFLRKTWMELTGSSSIAYKRSVTSFDGVDLFKNNVTSLQTGLSFRLDTKRGIWYFTQNFGYSFPIFDNDSNYFKLDGSVLRIQDFGHSLIGTFKGSYQAIPGKNVIPSIDQMTAGGIATVRGYSEGLLLGKNGYIFSAELSFPIAPKTIRNKEKTKEYPFVGTYAKGFVFADHAGIFPYKGTGKGAEGIDKNDFLMSLGFGLKFDLPKDVNVKASLAFPLLKNSHEEKNQIAKFHIEARVSPDFDFISSLIKQRKERKLKAAKVQEVQEVQEAPEN